MTPKHKSSDADNLNVSKRSHKMLFLSDKVKILDLIRKEKECMLRLLRTTVKTSLLSIKW
jgi:hypothetical protein